MGKVGTGEKLFVFLLRHGEPEFPDSRSYIYGQTDYPLSRTGYAEARSLGRALAHVDMRRVISSDLKRARETAEVVCRMQASQKKVELDQRLREIHMGDWDGLPKEEVAAKFPNMFEKRGADITSVCAPGGESFEELRVRAIGALDSIAEATPHGGPILIVAHGGLFWAMVSGLFGIPMSQMVRFGLDYCALHLLERAPGKAWRMIRYNWSPDPAGFTEYPIHLLEEK